MKIKKLLLAILTLGVAACAAAGFSACAKETAHEHDYGEWTDLVNTCEVHTQKRECESCDSEQTRTLKADGHSYGEWTDLVNTCEVHIQKRECESCKNEQIQTLKADGHSYGEWADLVNTCEVHTQKRECGNCESEQTRTLKADGHSYGEWTDLVNICEFHIQKRLCSECENEEVRELEAAGHQFTFWQDMINTCERRLQRSVCAECGKEQMQELKTEGHKFDGGVCETCGVDESITTLGKYSSTYGLNYFAYNGYADECELYCRIDNAVRTFHTNGKDCKKDGYGNFTFAEIDLSDLNLSVKRAVSVWKTFKDDNPIYYWFANSVHIVGEKLALIVEDEYSVGNKRKETNDFVYAEIAKYAALTSVNDDAYRTALCYHDAIINAVDYAYDNNGKPQSATWAHNILGVLQKKGAVCEAYARTFQLLLNYSGIENIFVAGEAGEDHAWNLVKLDDNNWYWCDLTWDDTPNWEWGISYNYFMVNDTQNVTWRDAGWKNTEKSFTDSHTAATPNEDAQYFLYGLPARADSVYSSDGNLLLRDTFEIGNMTYAVIGYNTVQLVKVEVKGDVVIPQTVTADDGNTYTVISVGIIKNGLFVDGYVLFGDGKTVTVTVTVTLPASIRFIWDRALTGYFNPNCYYWDRMKDDVGLGIEAFKCPTMVVDYFVDNDNEWFKDVDGVLFTKSMKTLIAYPAANKRDSFVIPDTVEQTAHAAFVNCIYLQELNVGKGVEEVGVLCWGRHYETISGELHSSNLVSGEFEKIWGNMAKDTAILIFDDNPNYVKRADAIYRVHSDGRETKVAELINQWWNT